MSRWLNAYQHRRVRNSLIILGLLLLVLFAVLTWRTVQIYQRDLPSFEALHNIEQDVNTKIYDRNGVLIAQLYAENRVLTPYKEFPKYLTGMLMASEDRDFYSHWGINLRRTFIVAATNMAKLQITGGASTITQQVARMLFLNQEQTMARKVKEALTAVKLERSYSKEEILEFYLNQHYFSHGAYGVSSAARVFFNKSVPELSPNDCALLIGMLKGPNINSPFTSPDKALIARNRVLYSYYDVGGFSRQEYDSLRQLPLAFVNTIPETKPAAYFVESVRQYLIDKYGERAVYSGGLTVQTSLDSRLQKVAEASLAKKIDSLRAEIKRERSSRDPRYTIMVPDTSTENPNDSIRVYKKVQGAFLAMDNATGDILAMVGGRDFRESEFNRATQALRQPGSSFKPFVYTAAIDNGMKPSDMMDDSPIVLEIPGSKEWRPANYDDKFLGPLTLRDAIRQSRNLVAIRLMHRVSADETIHYARRMGITSDLAPVPSLAIGVSEVHMTELVGAYSVFPNGGVKISPRMITKITDRYGQILEQSGSVKKEEVLNPQTAAIMVDMMKSVVNDGTAHRARLMGFQWPAGGKTGTSDNFCDNWFVGFTPYITAGTWVGFDDKTSLGSAEDGAKNAVPTWTDFMIAAHDTLPLKDFPDPGGLTRDYICTESGELATDKCKHVFNEIFLLENQPSAICTLHPSHHRYVPEDNDSLPADSGQMERDHF